MIRSVEILPDGFLKTPARTALVLLVVFALQPAAAGAVKLDKAGAKLTKALDAKSHMAWVDYEFEKIAYRTQETPPEVWLDFSIFDGRDYGDEIWTQYRVRVKALKSIGIEKGRGTCSLRFTSVPDTAGVLEISSEERTTFDGVPDTEFSEPEKPTVIGYYSCGLAQTLQRELTQLRKALWKADPDFATRHMTEVDEDEEEEEGDEEDDDETDPLDRLNEPPAAL